MDQFSIPRSIVLKIGTLVIQNELMADDIAALQKENGELKKQTEKLTSLPKEQK